MSATATCPVRMLDDAAHLAPLDAAGADLMAGLAQDMVRGGLVCIGDAAWACALWARRRTPDADMAETAIRLAAVLLGRPTGAMGEILGADPQPEMQ